MFFHPHVHSNFSHVDGMTRVGDLVNKAKLLGHPAMALTDHGNMAGAVQLYKATKAAGMVAFPGIEAYLADPKAEDPTASDTKRYHVGLLALNLRGYKALVRLTSLSHTRPRFSRYPRVLLSDLADLGKEHGSDVALLTGCFFGLLQQTIHNYGETEAQRVLAMYVRMFTNTYVELQHHNIDHDGHTDSEMVAILWQLAHNQGLHVVAGQDSHYTDQCQKKSHALMKRMVYGGADDEFPGDSFHFASTEWVQSHYGQRVWSDIEAGVEDLYTRNKLKIPPLDKFQVHMPMLDKHPQERLKRACSLALQAYFGKRGHSGMKLKEQNQYTDRLFDELSVISELNMANYFLIWRQGVQWCRQEKICIEARGSANGSLVCFLLGITQVDPIKWGVNYERFISLDRIKPPDVDMDIEDVRRMEFVNWIKAQFPSVQIGTWGKLGTSVNEDGEETGSVFVTYLSYLRRQCEAEAAKIIEGRQAKGDKTAKKGDIKDLSYAIFNKRYGRLESVDDIRNINPNDHRALREMAAMGTVYKSYGVHAGGVLLGSDSLKLTDYVPTMLVASSDTTVSQFDMDDVEELGLLKQDVLGQATLAVMRICQELIGRSDPTDFTWIPDDDTEACKVLRSGHRDNGVFHFEAYTKSKGGKEMGVRTTKDAIIATALYMPGCVDSGQKDRYVATRRRTEIKHKYMREAESLHPVIAEVLKETNGVMVFQEHPLQILRKLGMSVKNVNVLYKVLKDSGKGAVERNRHRLEELRVEFDKLCADAGVNEPDTVWEMVTGFMAYGFNKAHSAGYGIRSYRCAWLKVHYPLEFMTALLTVWAGRKKEQLYVREARRMEIRLSSPDVNISGATWTIDRKHRAIRRGLLSIPGIGAAAAKEIASKAPFTSIDDLIERCSARAVSGGQKFLKTGELTGNLAHLYRAGALSPLME